MVDMNVVKKYPLSLQDEKKKEKKEKKSKTLKLAMHDDQLFVDGEEVRINPVTNKWMLSFTFYFEQFFYHLWGLP